MQRTNNNGEDVNLEGMGIQHKRGEKNVCVSEVNRGGVCVWVRTDSPATPLPKTITASTTSSHS